MAPPIIWWNDTVITAFGGGFQATQAALNKSKTIMLEMKLYKVRMTKWDVIGYTSDSVLDVAIFGIDPSTLMAVAMAAGPATMQLVKGFINRINRVTRIDN